MPSKTSQQKDAVWQDAAHEMPSQETLLEYVMQDNSYGYVPFKGTVYQYLFKVAFSSDSKTTFFYADTSNKIASGAHGSIYPAYAINPETGKANTERQFILKIVKKTNESGEYYDPCYQEVEIQSQYLKTSCLNYRNERYIFSEYIPGREIRKENIMELTFKQRIDLVIALLQELVLFHSGDDPVVHGDIKDDNARFYIDKDGVVHARFFDFGLSRKWNDPFAPGNRGGGFRRAPELKYGMYTSAVDIYAFLSLILLVLGATDRFEYKESLFSSNEKWLYCVGRCEGYLPYSFKGLFSGVQDLPSAAVLNKIVRFLKTMQHFDPSRRPSAKQCLSFFRWVQAYLNKMPGMKESGFVLRLTENLAMRHYSKKAIEKHDSLEHYLYVVSAIYHASDRKHFPSYVYVSSSTLLYTTSDDLAEDDYFHEDRKKYVKRALSDCFKFLGYGVADDNLDTSVLAVLRLKQASDQFGKKHNFRLFLPFIFEQLMTDQKFRNALAREDSSVLALVFLKLRRVYQLNMLDMLSIDAEKYLLCIDVLKYIKENNACNFSPIDPAVLSEINRFISIYEPVFNVDQANKRPIQLVHSDFFSLPSRDSAKSQRLAEIHLSNYLYKNNYSAQFFKNLPNIKAQIHAKLSDCLSTKGVMA